MKNLQTNKNKIFNQIKFFLLVAVIAFGVNYVSAFPGPSNPPAGDVGSFVNESNQEQAKGGAGVVSGNKLDIDDVTNANDTFSTTGLLAWTRLTVVGGSAKVIGLNPDNLQHTVCADHTGRLVSCP